jgi:hypothetical protein
MMSENRTNRQRALLKSFLALLLSRRGVTTRCHTTTK